MQYVGSLIRCPYVKKLVLSKKSSIDMARRLVVVVHMIGPQTFVMLGHSQRLRWLVDI